MSITCIYRTTTDKKPSEVYDKLKAYTNNEVVAEIEYNALFTPEFKKWFAPEDWETDYGSKNHSIPATLLNKNGEPELFRDGDKYFWKNIKGERKYISASKLSSFSAEQLDQVISELSMAFISGYLKDHADIRDAVKAIDSSVEDFIRKYVAGEMAKHQPGTIIHERLKTILIERNVVDLAQAIKDNFSRIGITLEEEMSEDEKVSGLNLKDSNTVNSKDRATANIKMLVAFSPKIIIKDGEKELASGDYIGGQLAVNFDEMWRVLEDTLADLVPSMNGQQFVPMFEKFLNKLEEKSEKHPDLLGIIYNISEKSQMIQHQFVQALLKSRLNMVDTLVNAKGEFQVMDSAQNTPSKKLASQWVQQMIFMSDLVDSSTMSVNTHNRDTIAKAYDKLVSDVKQNPNQVKEFYPRLIKMFNYLKMTGVTEKVLDDLTGGIHKGLINFLTLNKGTMYNVMEVIRNLENKDVFDGEDTLNPFENEKVFNQIAAAVAEYNPDASETTILTKGGLAWLFDLVNFINLNVNMWKDGDLTELKTRLEQPYYKNSRWAKKIVEAVEKKDADFLNKFKITFLNNFRKGKDVKDNKDISYEEQVADSIVKMFLPTPMFNMLEPADKSRFIHIQGFDTINPDFRTPLNGTEYKINNPEVIDIFEGYFMDEYNRIVSEQEQVSHVEFYKNNRLTFPIFKEVAEKFEALEGINIRLADGKLIKQLPEAYRQKLREVIETELMSRIEKTFRSIQNLNIYDKLPSKVKNEVNKYPDPKAQLAATFAINGMIANIEMTKLFTGDPAYYKNMTDFKKRVPATYTNGMMLDLLSEDEFNFTVAVANDVKIGSAYLVTDEKYIENVANITGASKEEVKSIMSDYSSVERTDAQAYITPERWKFLLTRLGKFDAQKEDTYQRIINGNPTPEDVKIAAQPLKGVYFSVIGGKPTYLKYSQSVLIPALVKGTQLEALAEKMKGDPKKGQAKVDELVFLSGVKVGAERTNTIHDDNGNLVLPDKLDVMILDNRFWKLQQDLPNKGIKPTALGSQIQKNVFADFSRSATYNYAGKEITGDELYQTIDAAFSELSDMGVKSIVEELFTNGVVDKTKLVKLVLAEVKRTGNDTNLIEAIEKNLPYDAVPAFKAKLESILFSKISAKTTKFKTAGGALIQMANFGLDRLTDKEQSGIVWLNKTELKPPLIVDGKLQPGQVLIPHSMIAKYIPGYRNMTGEQLKKKIDSELLELIGYRIPNQGMSSNDFLEVVGILPDTVGDTIVAYTEITAKTGSDFDIDKMYVMLPEMFPTYDNPNKVAKDFLDSLSDSAKKSVEKILIDNGLLKENYSGEVHLISAIRKLVLDKLEDTETEVQELLDIKETFEDYIEKNPKEVNKLKYVNHNGKSAKALHNRIFQGYKAILTHVNTYLPLVTSIDKGTQKIKKDIEELYGKELKSGFDHIDPLIELKSKKGLIEGKNGVGTTANNLVDHVISQLHPLFVNEYIGFGHETKQGKTDLSQIKDTNNGNKITDIISAFLNAFVDIAKDPYILRGNYNDHTTNTAFLLLRAGTPLDVVNRIIGQSALRTYAKNKSTQASSINDPFKIGEKLVNAIDYQKGTKFGDDVLAKEVKNKIEGMTLSQIASTYMSKANLEKNLKNPDATTQYAVLVYFEKLQPYVSGLQNIVRATKSDVTGATSSAADRQVFESNFNRAITDDKFSGVSERFNGTRFGKFYENSVMFAGRLAGQLFLTETTSLRIAKNTILDSINKNLTTNPEALKLINSEMYAYLMSNSSYANTDIKELINSVPKKVLEYQGKLNNYLLNNLVVKVVKNQIFVSTDTSRRLSDSEKNLMYKGWVDLFGHKDEDVRMFARELIQYAYHTSGFKHGVGRFFTHIPHEWIGWEYVDERMKELHDELHNSDILANQLTITFMRQFAQHNVETKIGNKDLIPAVPSGKRATAKDSAGREIPKDQVFLIHKPEESTPQLLLNNGKDSPIVMPQFLKIPSTKTSEAKLYEYKGIDVNNQFGHRYERITPLGMSAKGMRVIEYAYHTVNDSVIPANKTITYQGESITEAPKLEVKEETPETKVEFSLDMMQNVVEGAPDIEENNLDNSEKSITFANVDNQLKELLKIDPKFMSRYGVLNESYIDTLTEEEKAIIIKDFCKK